jgi:hypothetical protein
MAAKNCEDCGVKLTMLNRHLKYKEKCHPCGHKEFVRPRVCSGCGGQIDRAEKHWVLKSGGFVCNACHEDPNRQVEGRVCSGCGGQLESAEKSWRLKDGSGFLCNACHEERTKKEELRVCSVCGRQIDTGEKHWELNNGSFECNACREDHKCSVCGRQIDTAEKHWELKDGSGFQCNACHERVKTIPFLTYLGGFAGVTKHQTVGMHFGATQLTVETTIGGTPLWAMPYDKIKDIRIDTAEHLTATRLFLTGILAFGLKKKSRYLVVSFEDEHGLLQNPVFEGHRINDVQQTIYQLIEITRVRPQKPPQPQQPQAAPIDVTEQIKKLGDLRDQGLLTEQEFDSKKQELLARM